MKKLIAFLVLATHAFYSCSDQDDFDIETSLVGTWSVFRYEISEFPQSNVHQRLEFKIDGSLIRSDVVTDSSDKQILGYVSQALGTYEVDGDRIKLSYPGIHFQSDTSVPFVALNDLEFQEVGFFHEYVFSLTKTDLYMSYICKPNENCANTGPTKFVRVHD
ncbi:hypothetical protein [Flagellimonas myxillae]|uniref:hypothetical protein n=1 Tax=Flagellimonas myxillae TaxID=2942214 RepID=UPI00201EFF8D|nr:hypothetical protein [Muricauda myxillae]MCL6266939.1 hypothetical protein [Muricauda myxillae]